MNCLPTIRPAGRDPERLAQSTASSDSCPDGAGNATLADSTADKHASLRQTPGVNHRISGTRGSERAMIWITGGRVAHSKQGPSVRNLSAVREVRPIFWGGLENGTPTSLSAKVNW